MGSTTGRSALRLPDADDQRVRTAAIESRAQLVVTDYLVGLPKAALVPCDVEAVSADDFILARTDLDRQRVFAVAVQQIVDSRRNPPRTTADVLGRLQAACRPSPLSTPAAGRWPTGVCRLSTETRAPGSAGLGDRKPRNLGRRGAATLADVRRG